MTTLIQKDARNRAIRTFLQGLAVDVAAALALVVFPVFNNAQSFNEVDWKVLAFLLTKTAAISALSYLMRTVFDRKVSSVIAPPANSGSGKVQH